MRLGRGQRTGTSSLPDTGPGCRAWCLGSRRQRGLYTAHSFLSLKCPCLSSSVGLGPGLLSLGQSPRGVGARQAQAARWLVRMLQRDRTQVLFPSADTETQWQGERAAARELRGSWPQPGAREHPGWQWGRPLSELTKGFPVLLCSALPALRPHHPSHSLGRGTTLRPEHAWRQVAGPLL